ACSPARLAPRRRRSSTTRTTPPGCRRAGRRTRPVTCTCESAPWPCPYDSAGAADSSVDDGHLRRAAHVGGRLRGPGVEKAVARHVSAPVPLNRRSGSRAHVVQLPNDMELHAVQEGVIVDRAGVCSAPTKSLKVGLSRPCKLVVRD